MPLKFLHGADKTREEVHVALLYKLRHEHSAILHSLPVGDKGDGNDGHRNLRSLPHFKEMQQNHAALGFVPVTCPPMMEASEWLLEGAPHRCQLGATSVESVMPESLCVGTSLQWLFLKHEDIPLIFAEHSAPCRLLTSGAKSLQSALSGGTVRVTWNDALSVFHKASASMCSSEFLLDEERSTALPFAASLQLQLQAPMLPQPCVEGGERSDIASFTVPIVPLVNIRCESRRYFQHFPVLRRFLSSLPPLRVVADPLWLEPSVGTFQRRFKAAAGWDRVESAAPPSETAGLPPLTSAVIVSGSEFSVLRENWDSRAQREEIPPVIVPLASLKGDRFGVEFPEGINYRRRRHAKRGGALRGLLAQLAVPLMVQLTGLQMPNGRQIRQTLTLHNTAAEQLTAVESVDSSPAILNGSGNRRTARRRRLQLWLHVGSFMKRQWLAMAGIQPVQEAPSGINELEALGAALRGGGGSRTEGGRGDRPLEEVSLPMLPAAELKSDDVVGLGASWLPLAARINADEGGDAGSMSGSVSSPQHHIGAGGSACSDAVSECVIFPPRVFSRLVELQSFATLCGLNLSHPQPPAAAARLSGEAWYTAACEHDVCTMPLPYRDAAVVVDDARLHYCYRLALHRERCRLGLDVD
uniref:Uncharacterized protein TCIL3000_8_1560 n=1 Tax=Trypanosoma congolense (strain IL3000) TaxID=1068625 RepID=G0URC7_TRYCI|nr:unnamed protein product [Trypanosoma congolense IL3000]